MGKVILVAIFLLAFIGCATKEVETKHYIPEYSAVSVSNPLFTPSPGQTFAWYSPVTIATGSQDVDAFLKKHSIPILNERLMAKGYKIVEDNNQANYIIGLAIVNNHSDQSKKISNFFHLFPSLNDQESNHEYATAYVGVIDRRHLELVESGTSAEFLMWRSSVQAFAVRKDISSDQRLHRLQYLADTLMRGFP